MGATKYPVLDPDFKLKLLGACRDDEERGLISLLWLTGMHVCVFSNDEDRPRPRIKKEGPITYIYWKRAKTGKELRQAIPRDMVEVITDFLALKHGKRKCIKVYSDKVREIGRRAGYDDVSPNTLRHTRCLRGLLSKERGGEGRTMWEMTTVMGCSIDVVRRNYSVLHDLQYLDDAELGKEYEEVP